VDSHGFRILEDQVVNVQQLPEEQLLSILKDSILYEDGMCVVMQFYVSIWESTADKRLQCCSCNRAFTVFSHI